MTSSKPSGPLRVQRPADGVVLLTLALPERRNAMTEELTAAWAEAVGELAGDRSVRAVVVTGEGTAFCAGGDLSWIESGGAEVDALRTKMRAFYLTWLSIRDLEVPVIAAVNGPAIGAGLCLALACDLRYAAPNARFGAPFAALGMHRTCCRRRWGCRGRGRCSTPAGSTGRTRRWTSASSTGCYRRNRWWTT
jgi:enoyl-CoA hydratase/carnithine racemase